ncbi:hypothetical protein ARMGADRAFT_1089040 [Armillaria gallica]|uniref:Uncharacterized protein n=1 Tax=Armillaria gallica TaxID=47427 RepID=A0A2H3CQZ2_ARMGA|nr:hypothetical protein ARMGADRAFT_1089040 [Armillaria gallica]
MSNPASITLLGLKDKGVPLETIINQCKSICTIRAELVIQHSAAVLDDLKIEDVCFCMKQVFKCILDAHSTTPTFKVYHTIRSFTGTIHSECKKQLAAVVSAISTVTTPPTPDPAPAAPIKTIATSGKAKTSKAPVKQSRCLAKSWAIVEDLSNEEASIVTATKEDMVMGNSNASNVPQESDLMNIDEDVDVIVNHDPTSGNIIEGHKITLLKFLKNKKASQAAQREKEKATKVIIAKGKANEAAIQARKHPHTSADYAFKDSPFTIAAINNKASQSTINAVATLVSAGDHVNLSKSILCSRKADFCNDMITTTHKIKYLLKYCEFVITHHNQVIKQLKSCLLVPMEDNSPAPIASSSKLD